MKLDQSTFERLRRVIHRRGGIYLHEGKRVLVETRLRKRLRALGLRGYREYVEYLAQDPDGPELDQLLEAITTNVSTFFRNPDAFEVMAEDFAKAIQAGRRRFRYWSAGCARGEEPYSLAIALLKEAKRPVDLRILATDISREALAAGMTGSYTEQSVAGVDSALKRRYFACYGAGASRRYEVREAVRRLVVFRRLNLVNLPFPMHGPLDAVLCRNVMIYFDDDLREALVDEMIRVLAPGGLLVVGYSETLHGLTRGLRRVATSIYRKEGTL